MILGLPALVLVIGLLLWFISSNPKAQEVGRIMFWTGLLAFLLGTGGHGISIPSR
jgi:hypothetical protein